MEGDLVIGDFVVRPLLKTVRPASSPKGTDEHSLPDKAIAALLYLAQNARQVCERDEILDTVWGEDRDAYDRVLDNAVAEIRRAFHDDARNPKYIQTIPKRGYRLLVPVHMRRPSLLQPTDSDHADLTVLGDVPDPPVGSAAGDKESATGIGSARPVDPPTTLGTPPALATKGAGKSRLVGLLILGFWAVILLAVAWFWPAADSIVRVEVRPTDSPSDAEVELAERVRQSLFQAHPCGDQSLIGPAGGPLRAHTTLTAGIEHSDGRTILTVRHSDPAVPAVLAEPAGSLLDDEEGLHRLLTDVGAMIDQKVCFETGLERRRRACHCRAATTRTFHKMSRPTPHIELLEQAIELDPGDVDSYETLAMIYRSLGDTDTADETLSAGLAQIEDPASVSSLVLRRRLAETLGDYRAEAGLIGQLRDLRPDEPRWVLAEAAHAARHGRDCGKALALISGLGPSPVPPEATRLEASESIWTCLLHSDRQEEARQRLSRAPRDAGTRFQLALGFILSGRLEEANRLASEYLALQPDSADAYWLLASVEGRQGAYSAARHWLEKMHERIEWPNQDHRYRTSMGWTDLRDGQECVERFTDMPEGSRPWSVMARWTLGRCQLQAGDLEAARETLAELREELAAAQTSWQEEFVLHLEASLTAAETDDPETRRRAAEQMVEAAELGPSDYPYFATEAGLLLEQAGELDRAREFYERAVTYSPSYPWGHCRLGLLLRRLDRDQEAAEHMRRALDVFGDPPEGPLGRECARALAELGS